MHPTHLSPEHISTGYTSAPSSACPCPCPSYLSNNKVRDLSPLATCAALETLILFGNSVSSLTTCLEVLGGLPRLRELELGGNPCALVPNYKQEVVAHLLGLEVGGWHTCWP